MIGAKEENLSGVAFALHVQDRFGLDDFRVVEMKTLNLAGGVFLEEGGRLFVADGYGDVRFEVCV